MGTHMGYNNVNAVYASARQGKLLKTRQDGKKTTDTTALIVLIDMASHVYDWPPTKKQQDNLIPVRLYELGWREIAEDLGMLAAKDLAAPDAEEQIRSRELTSKNRVTRAWKFLTERGLIKQIYPAVQGRNAGYLLLIGDPAENREVEAWARKCLGLREG